MKNLDLPIDDESESVQMGPLIDCVFLLLIFFMVVALTKKSHRELPLVQEPAAVTQPAETEAPERFVVLVDAKGGYTVAGRPERLALQDLAAVIREAAAADSSRTVWIETHEDTALEMLTPVLDMCRAAGLERFQFRTPVRFVNQPYMNRS